MPFRFRTRAASYALILFSALALISSLRIAVAQSPAPTVAATDDDDAVLAQVTALRDAFIARAVKDSPPCPIAPPKIVVHAVPSFGNYNEETNSLITPAWHQLSGPEKALFHSLAGPGADDEAVRKNFDMSTHHWIFVHEMGHWWQQCKHANDHRQPYQFEYEANRIDAAYWREVDPDLMAHMAVVFELLLNSVPNPVPQDTTPEKYFNENYGEKLARTNAYPWFQAQMITQVEKETPLPTFAQTLAQVAD
jgi:hypothetical protein